MGQPSAGSDAVPGKHKGGLDDREWNALIGIVTALIGNVLISFALNIQRYAHIRLHRERLLHKKSWSNGKLRGSAYGTVDSDRDDHTRNHAEPTNESTPLHRLGSNSEESNEEAMNKSYLRSPWWWAGIILMTVGEGGNFLAYGFAPASIVSPLGVVALISNCIIAPCMLKERFRIRDLLGVIIAVGGVVTIILSAESSETRLGPNEVWGAITRWEFLLYLGLTGALMIGLMFVSSKYGDKTILVDLGLVALFGGYTALSTKGIASMISDTLWRAITYPITYLLAFILIGTAILQIRYLNRALQRFDSTQVIPTQFVLFTLSVIIGSAVLYREFEAATAERVGKFVGGCALTFLGVYCITSGRTSETDDDEEQEETDEYFPEVGVEEEQQQESAPILPRFNSESSKATSARPMTPPDINEQPSPYDNPWLSSQEHTPTVSREHSFPLPSPFYPESQPATPITPGDRPPTTPRSSVSHMLQPISSPLSSSLSGVVADTLRRGVGSSRLRPRRSRLARTSSQRLHELAAEQSSNAPGLNQDSDTLRRKSRSRSLTDSFKNIFRKGDDSAV